jgi:tetratricopeptide (TPR) repeat protein
MQRGSDGDPERADREVSAVTDLPHCTECGRSLTAGRCLRCDGRRWLRVVYGQFVQREIFVLTVLVGVTIAAFFVTRNVAASNDELRRQQAALWFEAGQEALQSGQVEPAVVTLRRAVSRDPENRDYRLALASALATSRLDDEAKRVLLILREAEPEDPETNVQFARIEARGEDADSARRYYESAIAGLWQPEDADERRAVRLELVDFLVAREERERALSQLLVLDANLPADQDVQVRVGRLFLSAGDPRQALDRFVSALDTDPDDGAALAGAGESAFELADYVAASRYLNAAPEDDRIVAELREISELVLASDPLEPRLRVSERSRRLLVMIEQATASLGICLADPSVAGRDSLEALQVETANFDAAVAEERRGDLRDLIDEGVDLVYRIERSIELRCSTPIMPLDRALLLIGRRHGFEES